jgi:H+/Cl- antiporter ClcA
MHSLTYALRWLFICLGIGIVSGSASALFLLSLENVDSIRNEYPYFIYGLPIVGAAIAISYHYWGKTFENGNNLVIENIQAPSQTISYLLAPFIFVATLLSHLVGASVGREGTAIQMSASLNDTLFKFLKLNTEERSILLIAAVSAGFSAVFGTPLAGAVFALEFYLIGKLHQQAILPAFMSAFAAHFICNLFPITHTHYIVSEVPNFSVTLLLQVILAGVAFGVTAWLFVHSMHYGQALLKKIFSNAVLKTFLGGLVLLILYLSFPLQAFWGLGIESIQASFSQASEFHFFLFKLILTVFALSVGFKGGEVTPLFFIGATLGSALSIFIPLPISLLAAMGFVAVFAGSTNTPLACCVMAFELFGSAGLMYTSLACLVSFLVSGRKSIYASQKWAL